MSGSIRVRRVLSVGYVVGRLHPAIQASLPAELEALEEAGVDGRVFLLQPPSADVSRLPAFLSSRLTHPASVSGFAPPMPMTTAAASAMPRGRLATWISGSLLPSGIQHLHAASLAAAVFAREVKRYTGVGYSLALAPEDLSRARLGTRRARRLAHSADFVITRTHAERKHVEAVWGPVLYRKVYCVYPCIEPERLEFRGHVEREEDVILATGPVDEKSGLSDLVQAVALLRRRGRRVRVTVLGGGSRERDLAQVRLLRLQEVVPIVAPVDREERLALMRSASVLVAPCLRPRPDSLAKVPPEVFEAMAVGLPVLSTELEEVAELIEDGFTGRLVPPHRPAVMAGALETMLDQPDVSGRMAVAARKRLTTRFVRSKNVARLAQLFAAALPDRQIAG